MMHPDASKGIDEIGLMKFFLAFLTKALPMDRPGGGRNIEVL